MSIENRLSHCSVFCTYCLIFPGSIICVYKLCEWQSCGFGLIFGNVTVNVFVHLKGEFATYYYSKHKY